MFYVMSVCISLVLVLFATFVTTRGLQTSVEAATLAQARYQAEYREHLCGSLRAAIANINAASELLQTHEEVWSGKYIQAAETYLFPLEDTLSSETLPRGSLNCNKIVTFLHNQSVGETPRNFPNIIYRLAARSGEL